MFLIEKDEGRWKKAANGLCLALAKQVWLGSEIINDAGGHPYLVQPTPLNYGVPTPREVNDLTELTHKANG